MLPQFLFLPLLRFLIVLPCCHPSGSDPVTQICHTVIHPSTTAYPGTLGMQATQAATHTQGEPPPMYPISLSVFPFPACLCIQSSGMTNGQTHGSTGTPEQP
ncbi:hypothetical protein V8F20_005010 [Naviculisporaceae sp. PSN 640]